MYCQELLLARIALLVCFVWEKGRAFDNHMDRFLHFFDHQPTPSGQTLSPTLYPLGQPKNNHFLLIINNFNWDFSDLNNSFPNLFVGIHV